MKHKATYQRMLRYLTDAVNDLEILAGNKVGPSDASWQDVAGTCAVNLECLAYQLTEARKGNHEAVLVFPAVSDLDLE